METDLDYTNPGFTAIIPVYNRERTIQRAIESVLNQSYPAREVLVIDDGSTDRSAELIQAFGDKVTYLFQPNAGASAARNLGVQRATQPFVAFLDSDDYWTEDHLAEIAKAIEATQGQADLYFADLRRTSESGGGLLWNAGEFGIFGPHSLAADGTDWAMRSLQPMMLQSSAFRRSAYLACGGLDPNFEVREDTQLFFKMAFGRPVCAVNSCGAVMTSDAEQERLTKQLHGDSYSYWRHTEILYRDLLRAFPHLSSRHRETLRYRLASAYLALGHIACREGRWDLAVQNGLKAAGTSPRRLLDGMGRTLFGREEVEPASDDECRGDRPLVSVALPVYNGENYLEEAIHCILDQSFTDLELILCDNASTDRTEEICRAAAEADERVRYSRSETNLGAAPNFNRAFDLARGKYFKWAAHDDLCKPDFLARCVEILESQVDAVLCHTDVEWIDEKGTFLRHYDPDLPEIGSESRVARFRNLVLSDHYCIDIFGLIRHSALVGTPLIGSYIGSDRVLLAELGLKGKFYRVLEPLFQSRDHQERSIRSMKIRERGAWFNVALKGKTVLPHWRCLAELLRSIQRSGRSPLDQMRCGGVLLPWIWRHREFLKGDLTGAIKQKLGMGQTQPSSSETITLVEGQKP